MRDGFAINEFASYNVTDRQTVRVSYLSILYTIVMKIVIRENYDGGILPKKKTQVTEHEVGTNVV